MKHKVELVNPLDCLNCPDTGVRLNYRFRSAEFEGTSQLIEERLEEGRIKDMNGTLTKEVKKEEVKKEEKKETPKKEEPKEAKKEVTKETVKKEEAKETSKEKQKDSKKNK